jgi:hypothetical protein
MLSRMVHFEVPPVDACTELYAFVYGVVEQKLYAITFLRS